MKDWEKFESAVERFVAAFDSSVTVRRNVMLPDRDTGHPRQRDVWVETKICNLFPVYILISCKKWAAKLDESDIDAFVGELRSSGAHKGVIYSEKGFTDPAIRKAQTLNISCCKLYEAEPADVPDSLKFDFYCLTPKYRVRVYPEGREAWSNVLLGDIFNCSAGFSEEGEVLLDKLVRVFHEAESQSVTEAAGRLRNLKGWAISARSHGSPSLTLVLEGNWNVYQARLEGYLLEGSYSFTERQFVGSETTPWVDTRSSHPGPDWEKIEDFPERLSQCIVTIVLSQGDLRASLVENYAAKFVRDLSS